MYSKFRGYKLCKQCGQPMLKKGQKRKHPDEYRHAQGCPLASAAERRSWQALEEMEKRLAAKRPEG